MGRNIFLFVIFLATSIHCKKLIPKDIVPGHLDYDPAFQRLFPHIKPNNVDARIVGGIEVTPHSRPYQVGIIVPVSNGGAYFCGASLINSMNILTAAHCVDSLDGSLTAFLGAHTMPPDPSENALEVATDDVVVHPDWDREVLRNDIALIRLKQPIQLTSTINSILLPRDSTQDYLGNTTLVTGWGRTIELAPGISSVLNEQSSHVMSNYACRLAYIGYVEDTNICMASYVGRATCSGDSGGPLTVNGVQVGIVSFGSGWGCAQGFPSVFTRVTSFLDWIKANLAPIPDTTTTSSTISTTTSTTTVSTTSESTSSSSSSPSTEATTSSSEITTSPSSSPTVPSTSESIPSSSETSTTTTTTSAR